MDLLIQAISNEMISLSAWLRCDPSMYGTAASRHLEGGALQPAPGDGTRADIGTWAATEGCRR